MPPFMTKKIAGLPVWAWMALTAAGVGVGLILRSRNSDEAELGEDPCDPESESYDPTKCNEVEKTGITAGYDSADPCDPTSVTYDPAACQATAGIGYESAGGAGGPGGAYIYPPEAQEQYAPETPMAPNESELGTAEEGGIHIDSPLVTIQQTVRGGSECKAKKKPKSKKGFVVECHDGRWTYVPQKHKAKQQQKSRHKKLTGGGAPHKRKDKTHPHGKRRKHKVRH